jgi:hypothetical protein
MSKVLEFRTVEELNRYLDNNIMKSQWEIKVVARMFESPTTKLLTSCLTYILVMN